MQGLIDRRILQFAPGASRWIALTFFSGLIGSLANIALLLLAGRIIVDIYEGRALFSMFDLFLGMLAAVGLRALAEASRDITSQRSAALVKSAVRKTQPASAGLRPLVRRATQYRSPGHHHCGWS